MTKYYSEEEVGEMLSVLFESVARAYGAVQCAVDENCDLPVDYLKKHMLQDLKKPLDKLNINIDGVIANARWDAIKRHNRSDYEC